MSASRVRSALVAATLTLAWAAIAIGAFEPFYLRIYAQRTALSKQWLELPYRRIPGLRTVLNEANLRTPPGARVLIALPHRPWQSGYGYGFRRAQYVLQGKVAVPLLDRTTDMLDPSSVRRADYIICWRECVTPPGFAVAWRNQDGALLRRAE
ncbi:MAG TPA: hypothetical protein VEK79_08395 [Thermoanaerobaculia bacterium]|nr:hypothetical protein [Thermoanaerobaculia bacterium]